MRTEVRVSFPSEDEVIGSDLYAEEYLGTMIVKGKRRIHRNTNIDELGDFSNKKRRYQRREVASDCPGSGASSSASCWGLMKDHDLGVVSVDGQAVTFAPVLGRLHHGAVEQRRWR